MFFITHRADTASLKASVREKDAAGEVSLAIPDEWKSEIIHDMREPNERRSSTHLIIVLYSLKKRRSGKEKVFIYVPVSLRAVERGEWRSGQWLSPAGR